MTKPKPVVPTVTIPKQRPGTAPATRPVTAASEQSRPCQKSHPKTPHDPRPSPLVRKQLGYEPKWFHKVEPRRPYSARTVYLDDAGSTVANVHPDPKVRHTRMLAKSRENPTVEEKAASRPFLNNLWLEDPKFNSASWRPMVRLDGAGGTFTN